MKNIPFDTQSLDFTNNKFITTKGLTKILGEGINVFTDLNITNMENVNDDTLKELGKLERLKNLSSVTFGELTKVTIEGGIKEFLNSSMLDKNTFKLEKLLKEFKKYMGK
jgi:hypothetical protein